MPGGDTALEDVSWEIFFDNFEESRLTVLDRDRGQAGATGGGARRFFTFVGRA